MKNCHGVTPTREHILTGEPITRLQAMLLYGLPDLTKLVSDLRRGGFDLKRGLVSYADAIARMTGVEMSDRRAHDSIGSNRTPLRIRQIHQLARLAARQFSFATI